MADKTVLLGGLAFACIAILWCIHLVTSSGYKLSAQFGIGKGFELAPANTNVTPAPSASALAPPALPPGPSYTPVATAQLMSR